MRIRLRTIILVSAILISILSACNSQDAAQSEAAAGIESYIQALAAKKADLLLQSSCVAWEEGASVELDSFELVETKLDNLSCQEAGNDGDAKLVTCQGKIQTTYNGENQEVDLSPNTYLAVFEDGIWKMCGYR